MWLDFLIQYHNLVNVLLKVILIMVVDCTTQVKVKEMRAWPHPSPLECLVIFKGFFPYILFNEKKKKLAKSFCLQLVIRENGVACGEALSRRCRHCTSNYWSHDFPSDDWKAAGFGEWEHDESRRTWENAVTTGKGPGAHEGKTWTRMVTECGLYSWLCKFCNFTVHCGFILFCFYSFFMIVQYPYKCEY